MAEQTQAPSAAILVIGDEILSGRTRDTNTHHLAGWLTARGVALCEARVVGDDMDDIADALNALRARYQYVFTSGGIGPTHDDITVDAIAKALGVDVILHEVAAARIRRYYEARDLEVTPARLRMARMPEGAEMIENKVSGAPGVRVKNIFVMAGVPRIFQAMLTAVDDAIERGDVVHSKAVTAEKLPETMIADWLGAFQEANQNVSIGSYPIDGDVMGVTIIARSQDEEAATKAAAAVAAQVETLGYRPVMSDRKEA